MVCVTSKDSDQPVHPSWQGFTFSPLNGLEAVEGTCDHWRLWSDCAGWSESLLVTKFYCWFCRALVHMFQSDKFTVTMIMLEMWAMSSLPHMDKLLRMEFNGPVNTIKVMSSQSVYLTSLFQSRLSPIGNQPVLMHILLPETNKNCPSWISRREWMTIENISTSMSTKLPNQTTGINVANLTGVKPTTSW